MTTPPEGLAAALPSSSNQRLLGAALAGLLCLAPAGCSPKADGSDGTGSAGTGVPAVAGASASLGGQAGTGAGAASNDAGKGGAAGSAAVSIGGAGDAAGAGGSSAAAAGASDFAGTGGGNTAGAGGAPPEPAHITSSVAAGVLTEADFKALCDARHGTVEVMPHCGGFATAKGFSYDDVTQLLSEHTCAGANTCGGWNCVLVD
jgi:hypothetical protein